MDFLNREKFEDTNGVIRSHNSKKDRQFKPQKTNNGQHNAREKAKD